MALPSLTSEPTYQKLQQWYNANGQNLNIKALFDKDPARFNKFRYFVSIQSHSWTCFEFH